jgi:hypothetical protein
VRLGQDHIRDGVSGERAARLLVRYLSRQLLARSQLRRDLLLENHRVLGQLAQLLLSVRVSDRVVVGCWLVNLFDLPRVVLYVRQHLVRIL